MSLVSLVRERVITSNEGKGSRARGKGSKDLRPHLGCGGRCDRWINSLFHDLDLLIIHFFFLEREERKETEEWMGMGLATVVSNGPVIL